MQAERKAVAITGASSLLGSLLIERLEQDRRYPRVVALDLQKPALPLTKTVFHKVDLTLPGVEDQIATVLRVEDVGSLVHLAFLGSFTHDAAWAHELESIGTLRLLDACADVGLRKLIVWSHGYCYGADPGHPQYLTEDQPLASPAATPFAADKIDAERQVAEWQRERPGAVVTVLRMAPMVSSEADNVVARVLRRRFVPVLMGYDPLVQLLHPRDAAAALQRVLDEDHPGVFHVAGDGVLPLRTVLALLGRVPLPLPWTLARRGAGMLWMGQIIRLPPAFLDYLRYSCVLDTDRARRALGFVPEHGIHDILAEFLAGPASAEVAS
jgi:UDP-glucose 4-epimerase